MEQRVEPPGTPQAVEPWFTWANLVTVIRVAVCLVMFAYAAVTRSAAWNYIGLGVYWALDMLDGFLARALHEETRLGAQMDILGDRLLVAFFYANFAALHPEMIVPVALFLFQFMGIDHYLSNQFMRWKLLSPNYFYRVDRTIWALNWSPAGKLLNSAVVTATIVLSGSAIASSLVCAAIIGLKIWTAIRMRALPPPEAAWPSVPE